MMVKATILLSSTLGLLSSLYVSAKTEYTGDVINGHKVVAKLDVGDIPLNSLTKLWLQMPRMLNGQTYHVPVIVARGNEDGNRLLFNSALHGDEINGIRVVQKVLNDIDLHKLKGTVVGVPGANVNGMYESTRGLLNKENTGSFINLNREFPGDPNSGSLGERFAGQLWAGIYGVNNFTAGVDFHTTSTASTFPNFVYADLRVPYVYHMTQLTGADLVQLDPGSSTVGALENILDDNGTPSITYELGNAKVWQRDQVQRGYNYCFRQMADLGMYPPNTDPVAIAEFEKQRKNSYYGNEAAGTTAETGGFVELYANLMDYVKKDQIVGTMFNVFGDKVQDFYPPFEGIVSSTYTSPIIAAGGEIVDVIHNSTDPACIYGC